MVHFVFLMLFVLMSPLPIQVLFHPFSHVSPPIVSFVSMLPSPICAALVPFRVAPSTHETPSLFPPFSISLYTFDVSLVSLFPVRVYIHNYSLQKLIYLELVAFLFLHVIDNLPLSLVMHWYVHLYCCCYFWCFLG